MGFNPFQQRIARVTVSVVRPDNAGALTPEEYTFEEHRMRIMVRDGGAQFGNAKLEIFGVPLDTMNQIARLWQESLTPQNTDTVAIDIWNGVDFMPFFQGVITWSAVDASQMPHVKLVIEANSAMQLMNMTASPYSTPGPVALQDAITTIAKFGNFAVDFAADVPKYQLVNVRVSGSPMEQIGALLKQYPLLSWFPHLQRVVVRVANAPYSAEAVTIADNTGKMGFPIYSSSGLQFNTLFNPQLRPGVALDVESTFDFVNRTLWVAAVLAHMLEPNMPGGQWTTSVAANAYGPKGNNQ